MFQQPDSIHKEQPQQAAESVEGQTSVPNNVLQLPTDSAAQSIYTSNQNHWPVKVDSFLMPDRGKELKPDVRPLPKYYKESFFAKDTLLHDELQGGRYGMAGDPMPYTLRQDNVLTPLLIFLILMLILCISRAWKSIAFQLRNFFHKVRANSLLERESSAERRYLIFAEIYTAVIMSLLFYFFANEYISDTYITYSEYTLMGIFFGGFLALINVEHLLQTSVSKIFFNTRQGEQWTLVKMIVSAFEGIFLTPALLIVAYFGMSLQIVAFYIAIVLIFAKITLFYKANQIFFDKKSAFLQNFLYFCTLEVIPPVILWAVLTAVANYLKVNY